MTAMKGWTERLCESAQDTDVNEQLMTCLYALAITSGEAINFRRANLEISDRWSPAALNEIKVGAWELLEAVEA